MIFALGGAGSTKGKRKRDDDDGGYHPKAGRGDGNKEVKQKRAYKKRKGVEDAEKEPKEAKEKPAKKPRKSKIPSPDPAAHPFGPM